MKIPSIPGESKSVDHEEEIDIYGISWNVRTDPAEADSGRTRTRAKLSAITIHKYYDASSPYLFLSTAQGKAFDEISFTLTRQNPEGGEFAFLTVTLTNCVVTDYQVKSGETLDDILAEEVSLTYEKISLLYTVQADDHSAGDEHEITYDIAAGV